MNTGDRRRLTPNLITNSGPASWRDVTWHSSNTNVISINNQGDIAAQNTGTATITLRSACGNRTATQTIRVVRPATGVDITDRPGSNTMNVGRTHTVRANVSPGNATNRNVTWTSSNTAVATINANGVITARQRGTTTITARTADGTNRTATFLLTVRQPVTGVSMTAGNFTLNVRGAQRETRQLSANTLPNSSPNIANDQRITWSSSDTRVATVNQNGLVTAIGPGTANIIARSTENTNHAQTRTVTVNSIPTGVSMCRNRVVLNIQGARHETDRLRATLAPANANLRGLTWSSSNPNIVSVDANGDIRAVGPGTATVTVRSTANSAVSASTVVEVNMLATDVLLDEQNIVLTMDEFWQTTGTFGATLAPSNTSYQRIIWSSSNTDVITVDENGNFTTVGPGSSIITARAADVGGVSRNMNVRVEMRPTHLVLCRDEITLQIVGSVRATDRMILSFLPYNTTIRDAHWQSDNPQIATVDNRGNITAVGPGTTTVRVQGPYGGEAYVTVHVEQIPGILIEQGFVELEIDGANFGTHSLNYEVYPPALAGLPRMWVSSNEDVATVDQNGNVTAVGPGNAVISVTIQGGQTSSSRILVTRLVDEIALSHDNINLTIQGNNHGRQQIIADVFPLNASNQRLMWTSSNEQIATVDQNGMVVASGPGIATITATSADGRISSSLTVNVSMLASSISLDRDSVNLTIEGDERGSASLNVTVGPVNVCDDRVVWSSSNTSVATVDQNGLVTAVGRGNAIITATTRDGTNISASTTITVEMLATHIIMCRDEITLQILGSIHGSDRLTATVYPANANLQGVSWSSADETIATVDQNGNVTAVGPGTTAIIATSEDGRVFATTTIHVNMLASGVIIEQGNAVTLTIDGDFYEEAILDATVYPYNTTNSEFIWTSSNENIVTVDSYGNIQAINPGFADITVTIDDVSFTTTVTVVSLVTEIEMSHEEYTLYIYRAQIMVKLT